MEKPLDRFESIVRVAGGFTDAAQRTKFGAVNEAVAEQQLHPFDKRNIHPNLPTKVRTFFDNGHYPEATFEAFKYLDKVV